MKILFDQGTPVPLRRHLHPHTVDTATERGWSELDNGALLTQAEAEGYEVLVTTDQNLRYQQNLESRTIGIVVLRTTSWPRIEARTREIVKALSGLATGEYLEIEF